MKLSDDLMIPVITTASDGKVIYKNSAAKRCIPSPRTNANIIDHISKRHNKFRRDTGNIRIEYIINQHSVFKRAIVFRLADRNEDIWLFSADIQLVEPEDISEHFFADMADSLMDALHLMTEESRIKKDGQFNRYQRIAGELISTIKSIDIEKTSSYFGVSDVLNSLKRKTEELTKSLNLRVSFDAGLCDPQDSYQMKFRPFAAVYSQLLLMLLRISIRPECIIESVQTGQLLNFIFRIPIKENTMPCEGTELCELAKHFPAELLNAILLDKSIKQKEYKLHYITDANKQLTLSLSIVLDAKRSLTLGQKKPNSVLQREFRRAEKHALEYLEAMFMLCLKKQ